MRSAANISMEPERIRKRAIKSMAVSKRANMVFPPAICILIKYMQDSSNKGQNPLCDEGLFLSLTKYLVNMLMASFQLPIY